LILSVMLGMGHGRRVQQCLWCAFSAPDSCNEFAP